MAVRDDMKDSRFPQTSRSGTSERDTSPFLRRDVTIRSITAGTYQKFAPSSTLDLAYLGAQTP